MCVCVCIPAITAQTICNATKTNSFYSIYMYLFSFPAAGVPPPTPFLSRAPSTDHNNITIQQPSTKVLLQAANENTTSEEISANSLNFNKTQKQIVKELDVNASKESKGFSSEANRDGQRRSRSKRGVVEPCSCESSDSSDDEERVVWVECERGECGKWRRLPPDTVIDQSK